MYIGIASLHFKVHTCQWQQNVNKVRGESESKETHPPRVTPQFLGLRVLQFYKIYNCSVSVQSFHWKSKYSRHRHDNKRRQTNQLRTESLLSVWYLSVRLGLYPVQSCWLLFVDGMANVRLSVVRVVIDLVCLSVGKSVYCHVKVRVHIIISFSFITI